MKSYLYLIIGIVCLFIGAALTVDAAMVSGATMSIFGLLCTLVAIQRRGDEADKNR